MQINKFPLMAFGILVVLFLLPSCGVTEEEAIVSVYPDGSPKVIKYYSGTGLKRLPSGEVAYYQNGIKEYRRNYLKGRKEGMWTYWYQSGKKWSQVEYNNGRRNGSIMVWYENGKKRYHGTYENDVKKGIWQFWDESGDLAKQMEYD